MGVYVVLKGELFYFCNEEKAETSITVVNLAQVLRLILL